MEDDDSCLIEYIEIVPLDNFNNCSDVTDVKQEPHTVKVYFACIFALLFLSYCLYAGNSWDQNTTAVFFHDVCINW